MTTSRVKLTAGRVRDFSTEKPQAFLWDTDAAGLAVRATPSGNKAYIFQGKLNGKDIRITIGDVRAWHLDSADPEQPGARQEARRLQNLVDQGIDPREAKRERIATEEAKRAEGRRKGATLAEAWAAYIAAKRHRWSVLHLHDHNRMVSAGGEKRKRSPKLTSPGPLAPLMPLKLSDLTAGKVESWLKAETAKRPTTAALAYRLLRAFIRWAAEHADYSGTVDTRVATSKTVKDHVPRPRTKEGDSLQREQLALWFEQARKIGNPVISAYLQGLLLTGARREELANLTWADVDFQWNSLTLHDKVEGERTIPLTPYLAALLAALPRRNSKHGKPLPWVFSSPTAASGRIQEPRIAHNKALAAAGLPPLTIHGLRRSFGTLAEWVEAPTGIVAQIQGHKPSAIAEKHYRRRPLDLLRMWHTRIEAWILEQAGIEQPRETAGGLRLV